MKMTKKTLARICTGLIMTALCSTCFIGSAMASETDITEPVSETVQTSVLTTEDYAESVSDIADSALTSEGTTQENTTEDQTEATAADPEPDPELKQGWRTTKQGTTFYYIDGERVKGWMTIDGNRYYFKPSNGKMVTGIRTIDGAKYLFKNDGVLSDKDITIDSIRYYIRSDGTIEGLRLAVPALCQLPTLPTGCEIVSWTMMVNYAGVEITPEEAAEIMPKSRNKNKGFSGDPFSEGEGVIWPKGLAKMTTEYVGSYVNMTGCSLEDIYNKLWENHPVVVWVAGFDGFNSHTVLIVGYDDKYFYFNDPWTGTRRKIKQKKFYRLWSGNAYRALSW